MIIRSYVSSVVAISIANYVTLIIAGNDVLHWVPCNGTIQVRIRHKLNYGTHHLKLVSVRYFAGFLHECVLGSALQHTWCRFPDVAVETFL